MTTGLPPGPHLDLLLEALELEGRAQRSLLSGDRATAAPAFLEAADRYRASFECAPPASLGRLAGLLKASVLSGDAAASAAAAAYARDALAHADPTPTAGYVIAVAALILEDPAAATTGAELMRSGDGAFNRAADAIVALTTGDRAAYAAAIDAIVADFAGRTAHLTGVPIADTAAMFEVLAGPLACRPESPLMPA